MNLANIAFWSKLTGKGAITHLTLLMLVTSDFVAVTVSRFFDCCIAILRLLYLVFAIDVSHFGDFLRLIVVSK